MLVYIKIGNTSDLKKKELKFWTKRTIQVCILFNEVPSNMKSRTNVFTIPRDSKYIT